MVFISTENISRLKNTVNMLEQFQQKEQELKDCQTERNALYTEFLSKQKVFEISSNGVKSRIDSLNNEILRLRNSGCLDFDNADCKFIQVAKTAPAETQNLQKELADIQSVFAMNSAEITQKSNDCDMRAAIIIDWLNKASANLNGINLKTVQTELAEAESAALNIVQFKDEITSLRIKNMESENSLQALETTLAEIRKTCGIATDDEIAIKLTEIRKIIDSLAKNATLFAELPVLKEKLLNAEKMLENAIKDAETIHLEIAQKQQEMQKEGDLKTLETAVFELDAKLLTNAREHGTLESEIKLAKENSIRAAKICSKLSDCSKLEACYNLLKLAFSKHGITHNIIRKIIPLLEITANQILNSMTHNELNIRFVLDKTLRTKKEIVTLDVIIDDNKNGGTGSLAYMSRSGGEKVKTALAVILALAELKATQNGVQLGFLFIDEPPFLDSDGISAYCDALETVRRRYSDLKIIAITHDEEMKTRFPQNIFVWKDNSGSHFKANLF